MMPRHIISPSVIVENIVEIITVISLSMVPLSIGPLDICSNFNHVRWSVVEAT